MKRDGSTLDLFRDLQPAPVVPRFAADDVKAWSRARRLSKAIAKTLADDGRSREVIAEAMSELLEEAISKAMLDNYAAQEKEHQISALRLAALVMVTGDVRALNTLLEDAGLIVVEAKYEALLRREMADEAIARMTAERDAAEAEWAAKNGRRARR